MSTNSNESRCPLLVDRSVLRFDDCFRYEGIPFSGVARSYRMVGCVPVLVCTAHFQDGLKHGTVRQWYPENPSQLALEQNYCHGTLEGQALRWYPNGWIRSFEIVRFGIITHRRCWNQQGKPVYVFSLPKTHPLYDLLSIRRQAASASTFPADLRSSRVAQSIDYSLC